MTKAEWEAKHPGMSQRAKDHLSFGRRNVYDRHPYFVSTLYNFKMVEDWGQETMAVDDGGRLFYDPTFVTRYGSAFSGTFLVHEVGHVMRDHFGRLEDFKPVIESLFRASRDSLARQFGITSVNELWNWAGDLEINDDVARCGWPWPKGFTPLLPANFGLKEKLPAEAYVRLLCEKADKDAKENAASKVGQGLPGAGGKCGGCAGNPTASETARGGPKKATTADRQIIRKATADAIRAYQKANGVGSVPGSWSTWADQQLEPPKIDWKRRLPSVVRHAQADAAGATDYRFGRPSRRSAGSEFVLPTLRAPVVRTGVAFDTSGSMGGIPSQKAAAELLGIVKALGGKVEAFAVDAKVQEFKEVKCANDLKSLLKGGGGTDMRIAFTEGRRRKYDVLVILTDAISPWPAREEMPRGLRVVVCVIGNHPIPDHVGTVIRVEG